MLKARVTKDEFGALPEGVREHYAEQEGGEFLLGVEGVGDWKLENVGSLRRALQTERTARSKLDQTLKSFEGIDPDAARTALDKMNEIADWDPEQKLAEAKKAYEKKLSDHFEGQRKQLVEKHTTEKTEIEAKLQGLHDQLSKTLIDAAASRAIGEAKGSVDLLIHPIKDRTRVRQNDQGRYVVEVLDSDGSVRLSNKSGSTDPMTIDELVAEMKRDTRYARAFDGSGASGSGAGGSGVSGAGGKFTLTESEARDVSTYRRAREAAEKAGQPLEVVPG
jgi:hypothetical protein